jgi:hypothetical protein
MGISCSSDITSLLENTNSCIENYLYLLEKTDKLPTPLLELALAVPWQLSITSQILLEAFNSSSFYINRDILRINVTIWAYKRAFVGSKIKKPTTNKKNRLSSFVSISINLF